MLLRTTSDDQAFRELVILLDQELAVHNGDKNDFFVQFNKIDKIRHAIVAMDGERPVGIGALRAFDDETMEVKRMFVPKDLRGKGIAAEVLRGLEEWARELGYRYTVLETATYLPAAVKLYERSGYERIPNYGQYVGVETSVCMRKTLDPGSRILNPGSTAEDRPQRRGDAA